LHHESHLGNCGHKSTADHARYPGKTL